MQSVLPHFERKDRSGGRAQDAPTDTQARSLSALKQVGRELFTNSFFQSKPGSDHNVFDAITYRRKSHLQLNCSFSVNFLVAYIARRIVCILHNILRSGLHATDTTTNSCPPMSTRVYPSTMANPRARLAIAEISSELHCFHTNESLSNGPHHGRVLFQWCHRCQGLDDC